MIMIKFKIRQMEYFDAVVQTLHFGRAATLAGVSQPALSSQIAEMEDRLGCRLFERGGKAVRLTEKAQLLQPRIERLLNELRDMEQVAAQGRGAMEGRFRLGIIPTVAPYLLPSLLPELRQRFPGLQLELKEAITASLAEDVLAGRLEAFIAALPLDHAALVTEELFTDRFFLAASTREPKLIAPPIPPESPILERLMLLEEGHCLREQALAVCGSVRPLALASYGATSLTTLLQMASHGLGVTLIPEMATKSSAGIADLRVVPFADPAPERRICLAWRRNSGRQRDCLAVAELIRSLQAQSTA